MNKISGQFVISMKKKNIYIYQIQSGSDDYRKNVLGIFTVSIPKMSDPEYFQKGIFLFVLTRLECLAAGARDFCSDSVGKEGLFTKIKCGRRVLARLYHFTEWMEASRFPSGPRICLSHRSPCDITPPRPPSTPGRRTSSRTENCLRCSSISYNLFNDRYK